MVEVMLIKKDKKEIIIIIIDKIGKIKIIKQVILCITNLNLKSYKFMQILIVKRLFVLRKA